MLTLTDVLVPGVGPVFQALKLICAAASEMHESQELCARAHKKLAFIYEKMEAMQAKETLPSDAILAEYSELVGGYCAFLLKHKDKPWLYRVVTHKRVEAKVKEVQDTVNDLMHALSMWHVEAMADERRLQEEFREQQVRFIEARLVDDATVAREVARVPQQLEALSVLRHELQEPSAESGSDQHVVRTVLDKVMRRSSVQVTSVPEWFLPPHKVEFEKRMFARGSFGTVHHGKMGTVAVVVKCLLVDTRENERVTATFRREADLWFRFRHPHVLTMYGACDVCSPPFIVCEYAASSSLFNYLGSERNRPATFRLLREAASGLAYLHEKRVVHADLKCDNILVMGDGTAKIADFSFSYVRTLSLSKQSVTARGASDSGDGVSKATNASGALLWRAPECFEGRRPTTASDVYSLGMCIIEAVSGELPWGYHVDSVTVRELVKAGKLPDRPEQMSDRAWGLVQRMCSFDPARRPKMEAVIQALGALDASDAGAADADADTYATETTTPTPTRGVITEAAAAPASETTAKTATRDLISEVAPSQVGRFDGLSKESDYPTSDPSEQLTVSTIDVVDEALTVSMIDLVDEEPTMSTIDRAVGGREMPTVSTSDATTSSATGASSPTPTEALKRPEKHLPATPSTNAVPSVLIHEAAKQGRVDVIIEWLRRGTDVNGFAEVDLFDIEPIRTNYYMNGTPLHAAAWFGQLEAARVLLENGADIDAKGHHGRFTALHCAAQGGHANMIKLLLARGANGLNSGSWRTPLALATMASHLDAVRVLLENGAEVNGSRTESHTTALHCAGIYGNADIARLLLEHGADVNAKEGGDTKKTPLDYAAENCYPDVVVVLLEYKADVRGSGKAALQLAAERGHVGLVKTLLARGVLVDRKSLKLAKKYNHSAVVKILEPKAPPSMIRRFFS